MFHQGFNTYTKPLLPPTIKLMITTITTIIISTTLAACISCGQCSYDLVIENLRILAIQNVTIQHHPT